VTETVHDIVNLRQQAGHELKATYIE